MQRANTYIYGLGAQVWCATLFAHSGHVLFRIHEEPETEQEAETFWSCWADLEVDTSIFESSHTVKTYELVAQLEELEHYLRRANNAATKMRISQIQCSEGSGIAPAEGQASAWTEELDAFTSGQVYAASKRLEIHYSLAAHMEQQRQRRLDMIRLVKRSSLMSEDLLRRSEDLIRRIENPSSDAPQQRQRRLDLIRSSESTSSDAPAWIDALYPYPYPYIIPYGWRLMMAALGMGLLPKAT